ncbi:FAD-dependent urate hydroxylase [Savitreella phatthalungensis]
MRCAYAASAVLLSLLTSPSSVSAYVPSSSLASVIAPNADALRSTTSGTLYSSDAAARQRELGLLQNRPDQCPPCFNCMLPAFSCKQFGSCNQYTGLCDCPAGFGGDDCLVPLCGSLAQGRDRHKRKDDEPCICEDGWDGINCNLCTANNACNPLMPEGVNGTCYKGGLVVHENFQMCNVTNRKILDQLKTQIPQVTFSCETTNNTCNFQFWIDQRESFYCGLQDCSFELDSRYDANITNYKCNKIQCSCIPDRMLCGEEGSIDITDFLAEEIKGPGSFSCSTKEKSCRFEEPAMNELISDVFGDRSITLDCHSSECLHYTEVPGYIRPEKPSNTKLVIGSLVGASVLLAGLGTALFILVRRSQRKSGVGAISLPEDQEVADMLGNHTPATLQFRSLGYSVADKVILDGVQGSVAPGETLAIMGASGAGKTSLLDILARKHKSGRKSGDVLVNGRTVRDSEYRHVIGFVDQEDALFSTMTVYETVLNSALLRLPRDMSVQAKQVRVYETLAELGLLHIQDSLIGEEGNRGISGGEKRRVSIACELVTSPSIIFLDEPTSGLDSYNAFNVIECLAGLARTSRRTIVMTIHQPRSDIVACFDQLLLLAQGRTVYSGPARSCNDYLRLIGLGCPEGYNLADYLIDLTMATSASSISTSPRQKSPAVVPATVSEDSNDDEVQPHDLRRCNSIGNEAGAWGGQEHGSSSSGSDHARAPQRAAPKARMQAHLREAGDVDLRQLFTSYEESDVSRRLLESIDQATKDVGRGDGGLRQPLGLGYQRISWVAQFVLLSKRTFKNLYRNPQLLLTHYAVALVLALMCGYLFFNISNDLPGFQGRLGLFFFILAVFGFSTLTSLSLFAAERTIFMRERANGYYATPTYFLAKTLFDIVPLRVLPPILMGIIIYPMVGLVAEWRSFLIFLVTLVLFNLSAASVCLFIGTVVRDPAVANLGGSLFMLFSLLFAGLLLNHDSIPAPVQWLQKLSIFHYAYEALLVNEVTYLTLTERKFGLSIEVPGATILSTFGFNAQALGQDLIGLAAYFGVFMAVSLVSMHLFLKERR